MWLLTLELFISLSDFLERMDCHSIWIVLIRSICQVWKDKDGLPRFFDFFLICLVITPSYKNSIMWDEERLEEAGALLEL